MKPIIYRDVNKVSLRNPSSIRVSIICGHQIVREDRKHNLTCKCWPYRMTKIITIFIKSCSRCENSLAFCPILKNIFSNVPSLLLKKFNLKLFIPPFCTLRIIVKMSIQDKSATNENKFGPKAQHYVKLSEIISKCF